MKYYEMDELAVPLSKIVFGCENPLMVRGKSFRSMMLLDHAFRQGINVYDTARVYGQSERVLGKWINKRKIRDKVVIISKGCHPNPAMRITAKALKEDLDESLRQLETDYVDIYLLHRDSPETDIPEILTELNRYQKEGRIKIFGVSNWTYERIQYANECAVSMGLNGFTASSPNYGVGLQKGDPWKGGVSISGNKNEIAWYSRNQMPVFAYSCLGRGLFSGKVRSDSIKADKEKIDQYAIEGYWCEENIRRLERVEAMAEKKGATVAQIAMAYIINSDMNAFPIVRLSTKKRIDEAVRACGVNLSEDEIKWIEG